MNNQDSAHLGTGWSFPPSFEKTVGQVELVSGDRDIQESLSILLSTSIGERIMQPNYGCNLTDLMFEPLSPTMSSYIKELIRDAILYYEPRIRLDGIELQLEEQLEGVVNIVVDYTVISTNSRFNFVYPFYLQEGVGLA